MEIVAQWTIWKYVAMEIWYSYGKLIAQKAFLGDRILEYEKDYDFTALIEPGVTHKILSIP